MTIVAHKVLTANLYQIASALQVRYGCWATYIVVRSCAIEPSREALQLVTVSLGRDEPLKATLALGNNSLEINVHTFYLPMKR